MKTLGKLSLIFCLYFIFTLPLFAEKADYFILEKGKVMLHSLDRDQVIDKADTKIEISEKDEIHTGDDTRAKIYLRNKKETVLLYSSSFLALDAIDDDKSEISIKIGKARFVVEATVSPISNARRSFSIRTANAFIGIKGTDLIVQTDGLSTNVLTIEGIVTMANVAEPTKIVEISKNQASKTRKSEPPAKPVIVSEEAKDSIINKDTGEPWEGVEFEEPEVKTTETEEEIGKEEAEAEETSKNARESVESAISDVESQVEDVRDIVDQATDAAAATEKSLKFKIIEK